MYPAQCCIIPAVMKWKMNQSVANNPFVTSGCITTLGSPGTKTTTTHRCLFHRRLVPRQHLQPCLSPCLHPLQPPTTTPQPLFRPLSTFSALHLNTRRPPASPTSTGSQPTPPCPDTSLCPPTQSLSTAFPRRPSPSPTPHLDLRRWSATLQTSQT